MNSILARSMIVLAAIAMAISLTVALAPDASAQNSGLAAKDVETNTHAVPVTVIGSSKVCCICISPGPIPSPDADAVIGSEQPTSSTPYSSPSRWFCTEYCQGIIQ